ERARGREHPADRAEVDVEVLRLDGDYDEGRSGDRVRIGERRLDAVALGQLGGPLGAPGRCHEVAPAGALQAGEQRLAALLATEDGDARHAASLGTGTRPRVQPAIRYLPARPAHSP